MWEMIAAAVIWASPPADLPRAPYISCIDGHIAPTLADCPNPRVGGQSPYGDGAAPRGGGGRSGGLLGGLLGGLF